MMDMGPTLAIICAVLLITSSGAAQNAPPVNDRASPYALVRNWAQLPEGRTLGAVGGVDIDRDGSSMWIVTSRAGAGIGVSSERTACDPNRRDIVGGRMPARAQRRCGEMLFDDQMLGRI